MNRNVPQEHILTKKKKKKRIIIRRQLQGNKDKLICAAAFEWLSSNQAVLERSAQEAALIWSISHNTLHDEYAAKHGAPLTKGKTEKSFN